MDMHFGGDTTQLTTFVKSTETLYIISLLKMNDQERINTILNITLVSWSPLLKIIEDLK